MISAAAASSSDWAASGAGIIVILVAIAVWVLFLVATIRVVQKAGYSGWWRARSS